MSDIEVLDQARELENPAPSAVVRADGGEIVPAIGSILDVISRAASDPNVDVEKMERLMGMYERLEGKKAEAAFNAAMSAAQEEMHPVAADANNPQTKSDYASYAAIDRALRPIYTGHGFSLSFDSEEAGELAVRVLCYVGHRDGHTRTYRATMDASGKGAKGGDVMTKTHAIGSAFTYGQRYLLKMIFNVAVGDDDDGNGAGSEVIAHEQLDALRKLCDESNADLPKFCKAMGISNLTALPAKRFDEAVQRLEARKAKMEQTND